VAVLVKVWINQRLCALVSTIDPPRIDVEKHLERACPSAARSRRSIQPSIRRREGVPSLARLAVSEPQAHEARIPVAPLDRLSFHGSRVFDSEDRTAASSARSLPLDLEADFARLVRFRAASSFPTPGPDARLATLLPGVVDPLQSDLLGRAKPKNATKVVAVCAFTCIARSASTNSTSSIVKGRVAQSEPSRCRSGPLGSPITASGHFRDSASAL
jgi:hypothetical protein